MQKTAMQPAIQKVKDMIRLRDPQVQNIALDLGLLGGHQEYVKFIILGRSRTGSNFLRGLLNSHPNVRIFGELFQNPQEITWGLPRYTQARRLFALFSNEPVTFLKQEIFRKVPAQIKAVGFKIFYYHAQTPQWKPVWEYLLGQPSIRVLHIKRQNILQTHLSKARAEQSGEWANITGKTQQRPPLQLEYAALLEDFEKTRQMEADYDALFAGHPKIDVLYEDLSRDYEAAFQTVRAFLDLPDCPAAPQTYKQTKEPLSVAIANYRELKEQFAGSPWEEFFVD